MLTFHLAVWGGAVSELHMAELTVMSWPYTPNLLSMDQALSELEQLRAKEARPNGAPCGGAA